MLALTNQINFINLKNTNKFWYCGDAGHFFCVLLGTPLQIYLAH